MFRLRNFSRFHFLSCVQSILSTLIPIQFSRCRKSQNFLSSNFCAFNSSLHFLFFSVFRSILILFQFSRSHSDPASILSLPFNSLLSPLVRSFTLPSNFICMLQLSSLQFLSNASRFSISSTVVQVQSLKVCVGGRMQRVIFVFNSFQSQFSKCRRSHSNFQNVGFATSFVLGLVTMSILA